MGRTYPKPLIAAVNGPAVAGGFELVLACDIVVAAEHATFGLPEVKRGLVAAGGGAILLPGRLPLAVALEFGLTGDAIDAARAYNLGLVNRVVPTDQVLETALALAEVIVANGPLAVRVTKQLMLEAAGGNDAALRQRANELVAPVFASVDAREGATAFAEKRPPRWTGR
jgi:enoyl-CoA hydratase